LRNDGRKKSAHEHVLNESQTEALATLVAAMRGGGFRPHLLHGVTGSGKTSVYVAAMQEALRAGRSALLLVPEIGLTPAMVGQMVAAFGSEVALLHSQLTPDERAEQWHRIRRGEARVVVGTRSAVFAPIAGLGLILVDEEHDGSYKQEETPRYHARDTAVMRAKLLECTVVLGSATPSLESWANAEKGRYTLVSMPQRVADRPLPVVEMIDMREEFRATGQEQLFSRQLVEETQATLDRGEQAIILLNRRGYSFVVMCRKCGDKIECENCAISMTYHRREGSGQRAQRPEEGEVRAGERLECHYCGFRRTVPKLCPNEACRSEHLYYMGAGSQQGEERLQELFPGARIGRMDRDTVRTRGDMERLLSRLHSGEINLLVGTQMIAKGHDIHGVTLVGVVGADFALGLPDFRAAERVFQLITQVSGRAGRGKLPGRVLVQTYQPDHYVNKFAQTHDYTGFAAKEMYFRRAMRYPPFAVLANVLVQGEDPTEVLGWVSVLGEWLRAAKLGDVRVLGPAAAPIARIKRVFRYHFVLKAARRDVLGVALRRLLAEAEARGVPRRNVVVDVDAVHLM
jgi:primosomal protein N' (replication factor Y)